MIAETLENTDVYTPTTSRPAALVIVDILSTSVALRKGEQHSLDVLDMKKRLTDMRTSGVIERPQSALNRSARRPSHAASHSPSARQGARTRTR
ncbi:MAG: hypothetical protein WCA85_11760 [Paraburkholderia sp.]